MATAKKTGPLTTSELLVLWKSVTDPGYHRPLIELGEGKGLEVYTQGFEQLARQSTAIDRTTQSMFILPYSGQTDEPASGGRKATVSLTLTRTALFEVPITFKPGLVVFEEETTDYSKAGPIVVKTGRRYAVKTQTTFPPGSRGPITVLCEALKFGTGFNNAHVGNIKRFVQPGVFQNDLASIEPGTNGHRLVCSPEPDVVLPEHVGRYVRMVAGANAGQIRRATSYEGPQPTGSSPHGGILVLAPTGIFLISGLAGVFVVGEVVVQTLSGARGVVVYQDGARIIIDRTDGSFVVGQVVTGVQSAATATLSFIEQSPSMTAESKTAVWKVLDWELDLGIAATNLAMPSGGRAAMLDELGNERRLPRSPGEDDDGYRKRVAAIADVVTPNAIRRTGNRILAPLGGYVTLREVGSSMFRGLFYDGDPSNADPNIAFAYDLDFAVRPADRFKLKLDYAEFRGFFLIGVPGLSLGEFGIAYDAGGSNAYDSAPFLAFYDGYPLTASTVYRSIWQAVNNAKAGGVGFDLYIETGID